MAFLEVSNVSRNYEAQQVIHNVSLNVDKGEIISLLGRSGVGKTTLLNVLSGLEIPQSGNIVLDGVDITGKAGYVSYMQQKDLLLPFLKIVDNIALPLILKGRKKKEANAIAHDLLIEFSLEQTAKQYPSQLSGGMKQRIAFLRAYLYCNSFMLLDEPFSALDSLTKEATHKWFRDMAKKYNITALIITHDIGEAIYLSDRIYLMEGKPGTLTKEFAIKGENRTEDFLLSDEFIHYQREIKSNLKA